MGLVSIVRDSLNIIADLDRNRGDPSHSEFTVVKVDAYNGINDYLAQLSDTSMKTVEDIVDYNDRNTGTEGAEPGDIPAFPSGQVILHQRMLPTLAYFTRKTFD